MGSSRRRCCCGKPEGCARCTTPTTFFGVPPYNEWCDIVYGFTFGSEFPLEQNSLGEVLLPEIKSNYTFNDSFTRIETGTGYCECNPQIEFGFPIYKGTSFYYDVNLVKDNNLNVINPLTIGCTYDNREVFSYPLEDRNILFYVNYIGVSPTPCLQIPGCEGLYFTDIEPFTAPAFGITQHNNAAFNCTFRACGYSQNQITLQLEERNSPPGWCDPQCQAGTDSFLVGVTFVHADSYVVKAIQYSPVIRTIQNTTPTPTPDCFYELNEQPLIPGSINRPSPVVKLCYSPPVEEECRCQSGLRIYVKGRAEQHSKKLVFEEEQIVGPGGELVGNRNFIAVGTTFTAPNEEGYSPPGPIGKSEFWLYYYGCIDDAIYGLPSPSERIFSLDCGVFIYEGVYETGLSSPGFPPNCFRPLNINQYPYWLTKSECEYSTFDLQTLPEFDICPHRTTNCDPNTLIRNFLPASFFIDLGIPKEIVVKRIT